MKKRAVFLRYALSVAAVLLYFTALVCVLLPAFCRSESQLASGFTAYADRKVTGLTEEGEKQIAAALSEYFSNEYAKTPQLTLEIHGAPRDAFTEKELSHLGDIKHLLLLADQIAALCFAALLLSLVCIFVQGKGELLKSLSRAFCVLPVLLVALAVWAAFNFDGLFITFHKLLFSNNDWLLDPRKDLLLQLMPLDFFMAALKRMALILVPLIILPYIALRVLSRKMTRGGDAA